MIKGKTKSGFEFEIDPNVFNDWEILEALYDIDNGNAQLAVKVARSVLGRDQLDKLTEHIKAQNDGKATIEAMGDALEEIFSACDASKN